MKIEEREGERGKASPTTSSGETLVYQTSFRKKKKDVVKQSKRIS